VVGSPLLWYKQGSVHECQYCIRHVTRHAFTVASRLVAGSCTDGSWGRGLVGRCPQVLS